MKRSEMIKVIEEAMLGGKETWTASFILQAIEAAGMEPPLSPEKYPESDVPLNRWEAESSEAQECCGRGCHRSTSTEGGSHE